MLKARRFDWFEPPQPPWTYSPPPPPPPPPENTPNPYPPQLLDRSHDDPEIFPSQATLVSGAITVFENKLSAPQGSAAPESRASPEYAYCATRTRAGKA
ncbi:hypothetical protein LZ554_004451 [Drepanopeziza brunnea f. sp. 'monogermtubi']|nr:hypothetical protein LZ554_004451 [Drepanopeziza brunnea f. sp. 'monogermtubi']